MLIIQQSRAHARISKLSRRPRASRPCIQHVVIPKPSEIKDHVKTHVTYVEPELGDKTVEEFKKCYPNLKIVHPDEAPTLREDDSIKPDPTVVRRHVMNGSSYERAWYQEFMRINDETQATAIESKKRWAPRDIEYVREHLHADSVALAHTLRRSYFAIENMKSYIVS